VRHEASMSNSVAASSHSGLPSDHWEEAVTLCQYDGICQEVIWAHDPGCRCRPELTARCKDHLDADCLRCTYCEAE
jgi:hypothetical protein